MNSLSNFRDNIMKANLKNIGKKIVSLIMLDFGLVFLEVGVRTPLLTYYISSASTTELNIASIIFQGNALVHTVIGIVIIGLASFVWDWKKNWKIFGVYLCVAGIDFIVQSLYTLSNPPFKDISPYNTIFPIPVVIGFICSAIIFFVIGIFMIKRARRNRDDKKIFSQS